jgi:hypothetical protein
MGFSSWGKHSKIEGLWQGGEALNTFDKTPAFAP